MTVLICHKGQSNTYAQRTFLERQNINRLRYFPMMQDCSNYCRIKAIDSTILLRITVTVLYIERKWRGINQNNESKKFSLVSLKEHFYHKCCRKRFVIIYLIK